MADYVSEIKQIASARQVVYQKLSDLSGMSTVSEALAASEHASKVTIEPIDSDNCAFVIEGAGRLHLRVVEREPEKTIKLEAEKSPIPLTIWIQLVEGGPYDTRLRLTLRTELNFIMRKMIGGKLQEGVEQLATMMAALPYR